jgi:hypothetical protein
VPAPLPAGSLSSAPRPPLHPCNLHPPPQDVADACRTGAATDIIFGLALGYKVRALCVCACSCVCVCVLASVCVSGPDPDRLAGSSPRPPLATHFPGSHLTPPCPQNPNQSHPKHQSTIIPCFVIAICIYVGNSLGGMLGIACAALGMLSTLSTGLAIDA